MNVGILILVSIFILIVMITDGFIIFDKFKQNKIKEIEEKHEFNVEVSKLILEGKLVEKSNEIIDSLIREYTDIYQVMVLSMNELQYITAEEQDKLQKYIIYKVFHSLSPNVRDVISLAYNTNTDKEIEEVVSTRTKMYLLNYIVEFNKEIGEE